MSARIVKESRSVWVAVEVTGDSDADWKTAEELLNERYPGKFIQYTDDVNAGAEVIFTVEVDA